MVTDGLGTSSNRYHIRPLSVTGDHTSTAATLTQAVFVAPYACEILDISLVVTTTVTAHTSNHWTFAFVNQTGDGNIMSDNFDTDSDNSGNGGRSLTADVIESLADAGAGVNYLQNAILAKGDVIVLTATKAASGTALSNPQLVITYR